MHLACSTAAGASHSRSFRLSCCQTVPTTDMRCIWHKPGLPGCQTVSKTDRQCISRAPARPDQKTLQLAGFRAVRLSSCQTGGQCQTQAHSASGTPQCSRATCGKLLLTPHECRSMSQRASKTKGTRQLLDRKGPADEKSCIRRSAETIAASANR